MNLTNPYAPYPLSTIARIDMLRDFSVEGTAGPELVTQAAIDEVSAAIAEYLAMHIKREMRTEIYELRQFSRVLSLDARDVDPLTFILRLGDDPLDAEQSTPLVKGRDYSLNSNMGTVRLLSSNRGNPAYAQVTYTAGLFDSQEQLQQKHTWLASAAETQILYRLQRRDTLGGNVAAAPGGATQFSGAYNWLPQVRDALRAHKRIHV